VTLHRITTVELDCLKRLATAMKQHLDEFGTIPSPGHPIWRVFWAWSHINRIIYHHHEHPTVSFGQCGDVPHMEGAFASDATPTCESFVYDGHLMGSLVSLRTVAIIPRLARSIPLVVSRTGNKGELINVS
jgi:hypothetical protein